MLNVLPAERSSQCHPARWAYLQNKNRHVVSPSNAPIECGVALVMVRAHPRARSALQQKWLRFECHHTFEVCSDHDSCLWTDSPPVMSVRTARRVDSCYSRESLLAQPDFCSVMRLEHSESDRRSPVILQSPFRR
jgi:hypothetical protein